MKQLIATGYRTAQAREARLQSLRDWCAWGDALERGDDMPLMVRQFINLIRQCRDELALGRHPDMHRLMNLPRGRGRRLSRLAQLDARNDMLRRLAATLPADLTPWQRARALKALLHGPGPATGLLAALWDFVPAKELPQSVKQLRRIIAP